MNKWGKQIKIPAMYMRGGTSKGVFFLKEDLPTDPSKRDKVLLRPIGSPDPYGQQIDGLGGATSSTSKVVIVSKSNRPGCDVDYLFGQVVIGQPLVDWSGNCGNLTSAVGPFSIFRGLVDAPLDGVAEVNIWQENIGKKIVAHVPMKDGEVQELGDFALDGVTFPAAEIKLEFLDPGADGGNMFPTGNPIDIIHVPGVGEVEATLINAGNPAVFVSASSMGLSGTELQGDINGDADLLTRFEAIRAHGAVMRGLAESVEYAMTNRQHTPKIAFFETSASYTTSDGKEVHGEDIDILARILSMGKLHHAMTGTGAVAIAAAAAIPGTIVSRIIGDARPELRFGHPSGTLKVGAEAAHDQAGWEVKKVTMSRSARRLMEGLVLIPDQE
ncbi:MAG: 2-methylaconitate cis-trans isomerase PrpF [Bacillus sp. (in: Bacteria)]|uniref:2-methylaconitate cis-trans isomerase PrpF n=1 Tax=Bacillus TaxID=1386 RepID=UPI00227B9764|nr:MULTISPECIES: 2-methylaconitate cis-trans isomerase PrpF [Bacillus]MBW4885572.1 2-methylaconitate cis-trans isomerase PrpF [Bacillus sp. (in: firmicutes)]WAJ17381.1 2-methylaconitate cis-trans isomerase PrpF [Bacillus paralicheniformis]